MWTVMLGTALGIVVALGARGPVVRTTAAVRKDMEQHIVASGRVRVPARVQIAAQLSGLVVEVTAVEGQHVRAGDLLVRIEDAEELAAVAQAKANVAQAGARVDQLRRVGAIVTTEGMRQAHTVVERAESDLTRARKLAEAGGIAPAELDEAVRAADIARAQHAVADAQQVSSSPMGADSRVALAALRAAQAQLQGADVRLARTRVVALHDGVILTRACETGDVVQAAQALLTLAVDGETQLVFQADERDIGLIAVGQKAAASADGYPDQVFDAAVLSIAPSIDPQRGSVEVRLGVSSPPSFLKPEMTVSIDLTVGAVSNGLTLASSAVRGLALSVPWVYAVEDGHVVRHDVKLGLRGEDAVQIVDGLAEGAQVVVSDGRVFAEGQRVRAELE
jgi:HlyD family secretion protein